MTIQPKKLNCSKLAALATMCSFAAGLSAGASAAAVPKTAMLIPAPREIRATGGEYWEKKTPKLEKVAGLPPEGYELSITTNGITIRHSDDAGAYYAKMTLFHTGRYDAKAKCKVYPCLEIKDWPQFRWRGVHLDDSRRFFGKEAILQLLKQMSWFKFNVFHWHLTDDQLWSLEIPGYPELQKYGAEWYIKGPAKWRGEKVGPLYYTANDVKEILAYAKERHITVVPEIELPAHSTAAILAYPELYCFPKDVYSCNRDVFKFNHNKLYNSVYCFGNPDTFRFLEKVLDYVCELFPSEVIHIGGDECSRSNWQACPKCQAFIKEKGLRGVQDIQPWVTRYFVEYLAKKGRRTIGWDEIFISSDWTKWNSFLKAGGDSFSSLLPKTTMGMCWRTWGAGGRAANRGYEIVRCPGSHCYFDARQGLAEDPHYYFGNVVTTLEKVYRFDPYEGVEPAARKNVVGGQCCNWSTHTFCLDGLEWKMWPRGFALAEVLWTYPDPAKRDFKEFSERAANYRLRLISAHVNCAPLK